MLIRDHVPSKSNFVYVLWRWFSNFSYRCYFCEYRLLLTHLHQRRNKAARLRFDSRQTSQKRYMSRQCIQMVVDLSFSQTVFLVECLRCGWEVGVRRNSEWYATIHLLRLPLILLIKCRSFHSRCYSVMSTYCQILLRPPTLFPCHIFYNAVRRNLTHALIAQLVCTFLSSFINESYIIFLISVLCLS